MSDKLVGRWKKKKKKHWLKRPKAVPEKRNIDQNINDSESHIWNSFLDNIISGIHPFYILPHVLEDIIIFPTLDFLAESLKDKKNQRKRSLTLRHNFVQKTSLILCTLTYLTLKIIRSRNTAKNISDFTNFSANMFCLV